MGVAANNPRRRRWLRWAGAALGVVALVLVAMLLDGCASMGSAAQGRRLERMQRSPNNDGEVFVNPLPERNQGKLLSTLWAWLKGVPHERPTEPVPVMDRTAKDFATPPPSGLRITWLGHSTLLVEIDGQRVLLDPIWSERASPFSLMGPARFHRPPLPLDELPAVDAVVISHDHYDHLDRETVIALRERVRTFIVPLGVGAHLEHWGVRREQIVELDWWQETRVGQLRLVATPARHFSGRSVVMADRNRTLWTGWAIIGPQRRVFYSGDTAMFPGLREIGQRLGPFDATMIEVGAYDPRWTDVHLGPEQAVTAHRQLRGKLLLPVHWGTFALGLHSWTEPVERLLAEAKRQGVQLAVPRPGQSVEPESPPQLARWWPALPWRTVQDTPVWSSGVPVASGER